VASVAVTVKVDEFPEIIEAGLAETLTVGAGFTRGVLPTTPPHPLNKRDSARLENSTARERIRDRDRGTRIFVKVSPLPLSAGEAKQNLKQNPLPGLWISDWKSHLRDRSLLYRHRPIKFSSLTTGPGLH
jgi:hypothetical protein